MAPFIFGYLVFGALAGLLVGAVRRYLAQRSVAIGVGALIGCCGFTVLMTFADPGGTSRLTLIAVSAVLGLWIGALFGWHVWRRAAAWGLR